MYFLNISLLNIKWKHANWHTDNKQYIFTFMLDVFGLFWAFVSTDNAPKLSVERVCNDARAGIVCECLVVNDCLVKLFVDRKWLRVDWIFVFDDCVDIDVFLVLFVILTDGVDVRGRIVVVLVEVVTA